MKKTKETNGRPGNKQKRSRLEDSEQRSEPRSKGERGV